MKIYNVTFNDGGWHSPSFRVVAENEKEAIEKVLQENPHYKDWDKWATEFKIEGYVIEVYDEKSYNRDKKISDVL